MEKRNKMIPEIDIPELIKNQGTGITFLMVTWYLLKQVTKWIVPKANEVLEMHRLFLQSITESTKQNTLTLQQNANTIEEQKQCLVLLTQCIMSISDTNKRKEHILVVDNDPLDTGLANALSSLSKDVNLDIINVASLSVSQHFFTKAALIILNAGSKTLDNISTVKMLQHTYSCPIMVVNTSLEDKRNLPFVSILKGDTNSLISISKSLIQN